MKDRAATSGHRLDDGGFEARKKAISDLLDASGMDTSTDAVQEEIGALVNEGPFDWHEGVQLDVIWYGAVEDAVPTPRGESSETDGSKVLEFATPHVLLIDKWNGSGHEVILAAPLNKDTDTGRLRRSGSTPNGARVPGQRLRGLRLGLRRRSVQTRV